MEMTYNGGPPDKGPGRYVKPVAIALVLAGVAALIWRFAGDTAGVKRVSAPQVTT
ncbi:TPA: energy transducer TonB, partial [Burkholderia cepacia ATCC 25416]|nr:energy transducer TonB [Burkholderia cepacia ATCC 25416]